MQSRLPAPEILHVVTEGAPRVIGGAGRDERRKHVRWHGPLVASTAPPAASKAQSDDDSSSQASDASEPRIEDITPGAQMAQASEPPAAPEEGDAALELHRLQSRRERFGLDGFGDMAQPRAQPFGSEIVEGGESGAEGEDEDAGAEEDTGAAAGDGREAHGVKRPPPRLRKGNIAAAMRAGIPSAGLAWLSAVQHTHAAPAPAAPVQVEQRGRALADLPMAHLPLRYERELSLDALPAGYEWPVFAFCAFYEHSGEEREAEAEVLQRPTCSVANRRTILQPSALCTHYRGTVQQFVQMYPHAIERQCNHVECRAANWASWRTWPQKILDGTMLAAAEEFLWVNSIGDRSGGEQPPSALQHIIGPPTFVVNGHDFAAPSKTYCWWARNVPPFEPTRRLLPEGRWCELTVTGDAETRMLKRTYTPRNMATAKARAHASLPPLVSSDAGRPAAQPCAEYGEWRADMLHNFAIFASHYAPTLHSVGDANAPRQIIIMPTTSAPSPCFLLPLSGEAEAFGVEWDTTRTAVEQAERACEFLLNGGASTMHVCKVPESEGTVLVALPWEDAPRHVVISPAQLDAARNAGACAVWCSLDALAGTVAHLHAALVCERMRAISTYGPYSNLQIGMWAHSKPLVRFRTQHEWASRQDLSKTRRDDQWANFLREERARGVQLQKALALRMNALRAAPSEDERDAQKVNQRLELLASIGDMVVTAADLVDDIAPPRQGLPEYSCSSLRMLRFIDSPIRHSTEWLARLPPQAVPPGGHAPRAFAGIIGGWGRRFIIDALNGAAEREFELWETAGDGAENARTSKPRHEYLCLGKGAAVMIPHTDGIGHWNALDVIWEAVPHEDDLYVPLDFERECNIHFVLSYMGQVLGGCDDQRMLSFLFNGVRWGIDMPHQVRIAPNLMRMDTRIRGVGAAFRKLYDKGLFTNVRRLRRAHEPMRKAPLLYIPGYVVGSGGTDKPDNPNEKRIVGDQSSPHGNVCERNKPHGPPDGPVAVSVNDMMGPAPGAFVRGTKLDDKWPMPEPERKAMPRRNYRKHAILSHMAHVAQLSLASFKSDGRHMFFQFKVATSDVWTCQFVVLMMLPPLGGDGPDELWQVIISGDSVNMGSRNASKVAQGFTNEWLEGFSVRLDAYVNEVWLPKQNEQLQQLMAERAAVLGPAEARPFVTDGYTDDYEVTAIGDELWSVAADLWVEQNVEANFWLSAKAGAGTVIDFIGGRKVLNGGFGCMPPTKQARAIAMTEAAARSELSREQYDSHKSFLVHVHEWLAFPTGALKGLSEPLKKPGRDEDMVSPAQATVSQLRGVLELLRTRASASFWSGVDEGAHLMSLMQQQDASVIFAPRFMSDACTDADPPPSNICGAAAGIFFIFPIVNGWEDEHITLTEPCGTFLVMMVMGPMFPHAQLAIEGDASAALAAARGTASAPKLSYALRRARDVPQFVEAERRACALHCKGWGNNLTDLGSRNKLHEMRVVAQAFGLRLRQIELPQYALDFMADVLAFSRADPEVPRELKGRGRTKGAVEYDGATSSGAFAASPEIMPPRRATQAPVLAQQGAVLSPRARAQAAARDGEGARAAGAPRGADALPPSPVVQRVSPRRSYAPPVEYDADDMLNAKIGRHMEATRRAGSPQPRTASEARAAAASDIAQRLAEDESPYALCAGDTELLQAMVSQASAARDAGIPKGTSGKDDWGFNWAVKFGIDTGNRWMRPRSADTAAAAETELWYWPLLIVWISQMMGPSARRRARGFTRGMPTSALQAVYGHRRVLRDCGRHLAPLHVMRRVFKGVCVLYRNVFGEDAFIPERRQPFARAMLLQMVAALRAYAMAAWTACVCDAILTAMCYSMATGGRKDNWTCDRPGERVLRRSNFVWVDDQLQELPSTPEVVASRRNGHLLKGHSPPTKCDALNTDWGAKDQWFRYDSSNPLNFAYQWQQWELKFPCPVACRTLWPAFAVDGEAATFTPRQATELHTALMVAIIGTAAAAVRSWHSYRVTVATAIAATTASQVRRDEVESVAQMLVQWKTLEAVRIYMRCQPNAYADYVELASRTDASLARGPIEFDVDPSGVVEDCECTLAALDADEREAKRAAASASGAGENPLAKRRATPHSVAAAASSDDGSTRVFDLGGHTAVACLRDSWGIIGLEVEVPNTLWWPDDTGGATTRCRIEGLITKHKFGAGGAAPAYVITDVDAGHAYPAKATYLATIVGDAALRRRLAKSGAPRAA